MPTLLTSEDDLREQVERLEVHHLSSGDGALAYALILDGVDAPKQIYPAMQRSCPPLICGSIS